MFKFAGRRHFSFLVFASTQLLMDLEVAARMALGTPRLHGFSNTYLAALLVGALATLAAKPLWDGGARLLSRLVRAPLPPLSWRAAALSAFVGTISHVFLDSVMHADATPFAPFSDANAALGLVSWELLHRACLWSGALGLIGFLVVLAWRIRPGRLGRRHDARP